MAIKPKIEKRFEEFAALWQSASNERLFVELVFCLLTPQSKAKVCWQITKELWSSGMLFKADAITLAEAIKNVRFRNTKAINIVASREMFLPPQGTGLREWLSHYNGVNDMRGALVVNVRGIGYKEASHFLRNIGLGKDLAILDRHILRNLLHYGVIECLPTTITKRRYLEIEEKMRCFASTIGIPLAHLDLVFWYMATGEIFK